MGFIQVNEVRGGVIVWEDKGQRIIHAVQSLIQDFFLGGRECRDACKGHMRGSVWGFVEILDTFKKCHIIQL